MQRSTLVLVMLALWLGEAVPAQAGFVLSTLGQ